MLGGSVWISTSKSLLSLRTVPVGQQVVRMTRCGDHETEVLAILGMLARQLDLPASHVRSLCPKQDPWPGLEEVGVGWVGGNPGRICKLTPWCSPGKRGGQGCSAG